MGELLLLVQRHTEGGGLPEVERKTKRVGCSRQRRGIQSKAHCQPTTSGKEWVDLAINLLAALLLFRVNTCYGDVGSLRSLSVVGGFGLGLNQEAARGQAKT